MIKPRIDHVKQFTYRASLPVVALHTALIAIASLSMVLRLPTLG